MGFLHPVFSSSFSLFLNCSLLLSSKGLSSINGTFRDDHSFSRSSDREVHVTTIPQKYNNEQAITSTFTFST